MTILPPHPPDVPAAAIRADPTQFQSQGFDLRRQKAVSNKEFDR
jgi:hypothetical protein